MNEIPPMNRMLLRSEQGSTYERILLRSEWGSTYERILLRSERGFTHGSYATT